MNPDEPNKLKAVIELVGGNISGAMDGSELHFWSGQTPPTEEEIDAKFAEMQAEYDAQAYARNRQAEYPPMEDQLDYMYHNGFEKWKTDMIDPIKDKYPKG